MPLAPRRCVPRIPFEPTGRHIVAGQVLGADAADFEVPELGVADRVDESDLLPAACLARVVRLFQLLDTDLHPSPMGHAGDPPEASLIGRSTHDALSGKCSAHG